MKSLRLSIIALVLLGAASCKKSSSTPGLSANVSNTEAIDMVSSSLSLNSNGIATTADDATTVASTQSLTLSGSSAVATGGVVAAANITGLNRAEVKIKGIGCGDTKNDTVTRSNTIGSAIAYQYTSIYTFTLHCTASLPDSLTGSSTFRGTYSGPFVTSVYTGSTSSSVSGILPAASIYTFNGTYSRNGNFQSKKDTSNHGTHTVNITVKNLTLSKSTKTITGGTATFSVTGNVPKKGDWSYSGTLVYNGDGTANLTVSGTVYIINLGTGIYVKKA